MKRLVVWMVVFVVGSFACAADKDAEVEAAKAECTRALEGLGRGAPIIVRLESAYDWPALFKLLDSNNPEVRHLAADTVAKLAWWDRGGQFRDVLDEHPYLLDHVGQGQDPRVRAAVLAFVLPAATRHLGLGGTGDPDRMRKGDQWLHAVAPAFKEVMTGPVSPPYIEAVLRFSERRAPSQLIPERPEERKVFAQRVISAAEAVVIGAEALSADDFPPKVFGALPPERIQERVAQWREDDRRWAAYVLDNFARAMPDVFWAELSDRVGVTPSVESRRLVSSEVMQWCASRAKKEGKNLPEGARRTLRVLSSDWDSETAESAKQYLKE